MTQTQDDPFLSALLTPICELEVSHEVKEALTYVEDVKSRKVCHKCGGQGFLFEFKHVSGGICFTCDGDGWIN